jgi:hypothetical protein
MDSPQTLACLDRLRETQLRVQSEIHLHGELLQEMVALQKEVVRLQQETARAVVSIGRDKDCTPRDRLQNSSRPIASDVLQWVAALAMIAWMVRGGNPQDLLKALAMLSGG